MSVLMATVFVGPDDTAEVMNHEASGGSRRLMGVRIGEFSIQFRDHGTAEDLHKAVLVLHDALTELEAAAYARCNPEVAA